MNGATAHLLACGTRLHLQHGPIDLIIGADGDRKAAFRAAWNRFEGLLRQLVEDLPQLRKPAEVAPVALSSATAGMMHKAVAPFAKEFFVTPMAAVAGAVADTVLEAMTTATPLRRAYVNNGGDIALWLGQNEEFATAVQDHTGKDIGRIALSHALEIGGIATSGRHGRSQSLGIADSVTVLARSAAAADAAATLVANAVNLPQHPGILRQPANLTKPDSDLGARDVVVGCCKLNVSEKREALLAGQRVADRFAQRGLIKSALLHLQGETVFAGTPNDIVETGKLEHA